MEELKYINIINENRRLAGLFNNDPLNILIVTNTVIENAREYIEYELRSNGVYAKVDIGGYDNILQETEKVEHHVLIIWLETWNLAPALYTNINDYNSIYYSKLKQSVERQISTILENNSHIPLVICNTFTHALDSNYIFKINPYKKFADSLNEYLYSIDYQNLFIFDTQSIYMQMGMPFVVSKKNFYSFNTLYSNHFFRSYAYYLKFVILGLRGKTKKALIMDCDNTLWKGIVGEDGPDNLKMSFESPEGKPFFEVQKMIMALAKQGVIIGICSKNNSEDIQRVIDHHSDMILKDPNVVIKKINWDPKPENILQISRELNIGLDSIVFWDDNEFEIQMVKSMLPEVMCLKVPEKTYDYPDYFREHLGWFFQRSLTIEDKGKTLMYRTQNIRENEKKKFSDVNEYLKSLSLEIRIERNPENFLSRISQLCLKTNQFNLSTKRYETADIEAFLKNENYDILPFHVSDRFGDYGLTGLCILKYEKETAFMDTFLMSCRVLGRNLEYAFLSFLIRRLRKKGIVRIEAGYTPTKKNAQVAAFFEKVGFESRKEKSEITTYVCNILTQKFNLIDYIKVL